MIRKAQSLVTIVLLLSPLLTSCHIKEVGRADQVNIRKSIVASDTILSGMSECLLPSEDFEIASILPPGQCPGHYDVKLTDIARVKQADLVVFFIGMPYMGRTEVNSEKQLLIDSKDRNWMAPDSYITGLKELAEKLSMRFPEYRQAIAARLEQAHLEVAQTKQDLMNRIMQSAVYKRPVISSSMLREPLEWMGLKVVGEYGRPESLSAKEVADLMRLGRAKNVYMVVDNLQSGPDAGRGIAEALGVPHVVLSNFPMEKGYVATLSDNVEAVLTAMGTR